MENVLFYCAGTTAACRYAQERLTGLGIPFIRHISPEITHLLLDVPSFGPDGALRGGGNLKKLLHMLPARVRVIGGNLEHEALEGYRKTDLLQEEGYLAENAYITAECAMQVAAPLMTAAFRDTPVLVVGWGRIGKCLAKLLQGFGCPVTIAVRSGRDRALIQALGYRAVDISEPVFGYRLIFNTVPEMVLPAQRLVDLAQCVKIDLASRPGIEGTDVVWARGLPGVHAPQSSGHLMADTIVRLMKEETQ